MRPVVDPQKVKEITEMLAEGLTCREIATKRGVSHQAIESFIYRQGIDYHAILEGRRIEAHKKKKQSRMRVCDWCLYPYSLDNDGAGYKFCSPECWKNNDKKWHRDWARKYHQTREWKAYHQKYVETHQKEIREYARLYQRRKRGQN